MRDPAEPLPSGTIRIVIVSRLVRELKLEGILTTIHAVARLAQSWPLHLTVVGDGAERDTVAAAAAEANQGRKVPVVALTGEVADPRAAYDAADVCVGMGGSALRSLAFAKPIVIQGEGGFFELLTPDSLGQFLHQGFYGLGSWDQAAATLRLCELLEQLARDPDRRRELGVWGRNLVVSRFSLENAARVQEEIYLGACTQARRLSGDAMMAGGRLIAYKVGQRREQLLGTRATDDFNARPV